MYIPLSDGKHRFVRDSSKTTLEIWDNIQDKIFSDNLFFPTKFYFWQKIFSQIFSRIEFCLGLHTAVVFRMQLFNIEIVRSDWMPL